MLENIQPIYVSKIWDKIVRVKYPHYSHIPGVGGACTNRLFGNIFAENCMKKKEIGPRDGASLALPLDQSLWTVYCF